MTEEDTAMGTTPKFAVPYPEPTDRVTDYPATGLALANKVEAMATPGSNISGLCTAASGWSVSSSSARAMGKFVMFMASVTRTGAAITVSANGDMPNTTVCTFNPTGFGNGSTGFILAGPIGSGATGRTATYSMNATGVISIVSVGGTGNIATGEDLTIVGSSFMN
jgi:hypothetical protein